MLASAPDELARDRRLRGRALRIEQLLADRLTRAREAPRRDAGEHLLQHDPGQRVAVGEVGIGRQRHLALAIDGPDPRTLDRNAPAAERDLAVLVAVTHRDAVRVALALRAHDIVDLLLQHLGQHAQPGRDTERQQPLLRGPDQLAQRLLHTRGQHSLLRGHGGRDRYGLLHGGSSFDLSGIAANAPNRNGRGRRDRRQVLRATGQPPLRALADRRAPEQAERCATRPRASRGDADPALRADGAARSGLVGRPPAARPGHRPGVVVGAGAAAAGLESPARAAATTTRRAVAPSTLAAGGRLVVGAVACPWVVAGSTSDRVGRGSTPLPRTRATPVAQGDPGGPRGRHPRALDLVSVRRAIGRAAHALAPAECPGGPGRRIWWQRRRQR